MAAAAEGRQAVTSQEVALRSSIPPALIEAGVQVVEQDGVRAVLIPDALREQVNVLLPVSRITQTDSNWTPSFATVTLDARVDKYGNGLHFYRQQGGKLAPKKEALLVLAELAGAERIHTERMPRDVLAETELYGCNATVLIRRSDGRIKDVSASKTFDSEVEYRTVVAGVDRGDLAGAAREAEIQKRWLQERTHGWRKIETKAMLAAIREVLGIPHTFTPDDAAKPFLIVGYQFTPDTSDPEIRRLVIEQGLHGAQRMWPPVTAARPADVDAEPVLAIPTGTAPVASAVVDPADGAESHFDGDEPADEPQAADEAGSFQESIPDEEAQQLAREGAQAGLVVVGFGKHNGKTIAEIAEEKPDYVVWLAEKMSANTDVARGVQSAARVYARMFLAWGEAA